MPLERFSFRLNQNEKRSNIHEGRVGLRYLFNACEHQAYAEPLPVEMRVYK